MRYVLQHEQCLFTRPNFIQFCSTFHNIYQISKLKQLFLLLLTNATHSYSTTSCECRCHSPHPKETTSISIRKQIRRIIRRLHVLQHSVTVHFIKIFNLQNSGYVLHTIHDQQYARNDKHGMLHSRSMTPEHVIKQQLETNTEKVLWFPRRELWQR